MIKLSKVQTCLVLVWAVSLLVGWRPLFATFALAWNNDEYTQILLILPVSAALIYLEWRALREMAAIDIRAGSIILALAALITCFCFVLGPSLGSSVLLFVSMFALVSWWIGAFVLCFGLRSSRVALFPLLILFGLVPIPQSAIDVLVFQLQQGSAWAATVLFSVFGVPALRDGTFITIPGLELVVAKECSSIRSSSMLLVTTMVLAQLLLRSPWRKALVICLSVPLSIAKNGLRIFTIAMLSTRVDPGYMTGRLHHQGGIVFFLIALLCVFALLWILRKGDNSPARTIPSPVEVATAKS